MNGLGLGLGPWAPGWDFACCQPAAAGLPAACCLVLAMMRVDRTTLGWLWALARQLGLQLELQKVTEPAIKCDAHAYNISPKMWKNPEKQPPPQMRATAIPAD